MTICLVELCLLFLFLLFSDTLRWHSPFLQESDITENPSYPMAGMGNNRSQVPIATPPPRPEYDDTPKKGQNINSINDVKTSFENAGKAPEKPTTGTTIRKNDGDDPYHDANERNQDPLSKSANVNDDQIFARQTAPIMGGKKVGEDETDLMSQNIDVDPGKSRHSLSRNSREKRKSSVRTANSEIVTGKSYKLQFPQPLPLSNPNMIANGLQLIALRYILVAGAICYICGRMHFGIFSGAVIACMCGGGYWLLTSETRQALAWQVEKLDASETLNSSGETVQWLNYFIGRIWRSIDPSVFNVVEDLLEDILGGIAPAFIKAVKVTDLELGVHALQIDKVTIHPQKKGQREESIFGDASFQLIANPVASSKSLTHGVSSPPGINIRFKTGLYAPIDIKAELVRLTGKLRFKLLTCLEPPFVSKVTISFASIPTIETSVMPLTQKVNVMRLPLLKAVVDEGIKLGFADLVDPKSITLNVQALMGAAAQDTEAIGVVKVTVREAFRDDTITFTDMQDAYATVSVNNRPHQNVSSTRILTNDKDPRWDEDLYTLVYEDDITADNKVDIKVWDADKVKFDDLWGSVSLPVKDIVRGKIDNLGNVADWCKTERVVFDGWAPMDGEEMDNSKVRLNFKLSFHPKYVVPKSNLLNLDPKKKENKEEEEKVDPEHTSGILSVLIREAKDLEVGDPSVISQDNLKHPYNPNIGISPYAVLYISDRKAYQTRAKLNNPSPYWNAISEHFIKDFNHDFLRISIKNNADLEHDPVLGTKVIRLKEYLEGEGDKYKGMERWIPLANGIGFGKFHLNLKYKPVKLTVPRPLRGADVGTLVIGSVHINKFGTDGSEPEGSIQATLALNVDPVIVKRLKARDLDENKTWSRNNLYFPLLMRYRTALYVHIRQGTLTTTRATGRLSMKQIYDNEWQTVTIGLHDYVNEDNANEDIWPEMGPHGQIVVRLKFVSGFSSVHAQLRPFRLDMLGANPFEGEEIERELKQWFHGDGEKYGDNSQVKQQSEEYLANDRISKLLFLRKMERGVDIVRNKVDIVRNGFNSETRAKRSVAEE
ncbi:uncharacterized protein BYT42DRAFT_555889 [Radiomyces spectabilis]|uniref:uncharacterized protein n=1 Tax=Radiomyces spectabilis TaxID=64574 RepID=UPI00221FCB75|nr:uncharacterized protein BYT42DRAFT_555889 [Radiomyces spectabilis]KAI8391172.1 hypothetical protein BYT42DRAFT_555889 [Radiomyces spectabilis]